MDLDKVEKSLILNFSNRFFHFNYITRFYRVKKVVKKKSVETIETEKKVLNNFDFKINPQIKL